MQDALRALIENYCNTLPRQVSEIAGHLVLMERDTDAPASVGPALDLIHQISGLSGTMGYADISASAMQLEKFLRRFEDGGQTPSTDDLATIGILFEVLSQCAGHAMPESSTLYSADLSRLTAGLR